MWIVSIPVKPLWINLICVRVGLVIGGMLLYLCKEGMYGVIKEVFWWGFGSWGYPLHICKEGR